MNITPRVVDISHYNLIAPDGFKKAHAAGIWGIIHKATEATSIIDRQMAGRKQAVLDAGLLWGTYHFIRHGNIPAQVENYLHHAQPATTDLMALDWEDNKVKPSEAQEWLQKVHDKVGRKPILYSGNTAKELLGSHANPFFAGHRLWLAQYSSHPVCQKSWDSPWLWQYSGDGAGPAPHKVPGISIQGNPGIDMNHYAGTLDALQHEWVSDMFTTTKEA